jgi:CxxC motif-containing protein (DUF1111 family)
VRTYKIFAGYCLGFFTLLTAITHADPLLSGGSTTVFQKGPNAFGMPLANITRASRRSHVVGNSFFNKNWVFSPSSTTARDGLGPLYHARSCSGCHVRDGRGAPTRNELPSVSLLFRLHVDGSDEGDPILGQQLAVKAAPGIEPEGTVNIAYQPFREQFGDRETITLRRPIYKLQTSSAYGRTHTGTQLSPRLAQPLVGLGLLESVETKTILALADPDDKDNDGISGRTNLVLNTENGKPELGRFGWKSSQPSLKAQVAVAFWRDIGITSSIHPNEDLTRPQKNIIKPATSGSIPEVNDRTLNHVVTYLRTLAPPARRNLKSEAVIKGEKLFTRAGCAKCHIPMLKTGPQAPLDELQDQSIRPYTDLLLHDMGEALSDGIDKPGISGREWRTPPLWGIGLTGTVNGNTFYLHDGRARTLEEAIMWHGGEGLAAKKYYSSLTAEEREQLLQFLGSL